MGFCCMFPNFIVSIAKTPKPLTTKKRLVVVNSRKSSFLF